MSHELQPTFDILDLLNLPNHAFYTKLMIDGVPSGAFSGRAIEAPRGDAALSIRLVSPELPKFPAPKLRLSITRWP